MTLALSDMRTRVEISVMLMVRLRIRGSVMLLRSMMLPYVYAHV